MADSVIEVHQLSKSYALGEQQAAYGSLRESLVGALQRRPPSQREIHWALRDVDLTVREGEALGIVGSNGAGKSTLLKIIARITEPTRGFTRTRGRVGVMLEVGTGFHPELTGRENVFLSGAVMGMTRQDVKRHFEEIVEFAGTSAFLDTPLKRYSSGMKLRLAFAVAAHLEPELMLVDEILAVGDVEFQRRCLDRMGRLSKEGRTVLFVSHDLGAITRLCSRAVWTQSGQIIADGAPTDIVRDYYSALVSQGAHATFDVEGDIGVSQVAVVTDDGELAAQPVRGEPISIQTDIVAHRAYDDLNIGVYILDRNGSMLIHEWWSDQPGLPPLAPHPGRFRVTLRLPPVLRADDYVVGLWVGNDQIDHFNREVLSLAVRPEAGDRHEWLSRRRLVQPTVTWRADALGRPEDATASVQAPQSF
jgi:ABC-2 type transport system ATP-binding protein/lipopolysaccharide transport system ATP-binding protein